LNSDVNSFLISFGFAVIFIGGIYFFMFRKNPKYRKSLRSECNKEVLGEIIEYKDPKFGDETIKVKYKVNGKTYILKSEVNRIKTDVQRLGRVPISFTEKTGFYLKVGGKVKVLYKEDDPTIAYIEGNLGE
jgi:preprotein translocase subunit YajC